MAQAGYTPIQLYLSTTASAVPSAGNLANGELAINITDGRLFYKDNGGVVQVLATKGAGTIGGSNTQVQYNSSGALAGSANLTFDGTTLTAAGLAGPHNGTVGATTPNTGAFTTLSASSTVSGAGFSTYFASPPAIGGTAANTGAFTTLTVSNAVTLSAGTANGVAYLNGSKVLTTGSALTFDGATLGVSSGSSVTPALKLYGAAVSQGQLQFSSTAGYGIQGGPDYTGLIYNVGSSSYQHIWQINGSEKARLANGGMAIGSTDTSLGRLNIVGANVGSGSLVFDTNATFASIQSYSSKPLRLNDLGNDVQIGTTGQANFLVGTTAASLASGNRSVNWTNGNTSAILGVQYGGSFSYYMQVNNTAGYLWNSGNSPLIFGTNNAEVGRFDASGNFLVGDTSNTGGARLYVKGVGATSGSNAFIVRNSTPADLFVIRNDGLWITGLAALSPYNNTTASAANVWINIDGSLGRSTSALKYKQDIRDLEDIDINGFRPVRYKSKCEGDDQTADHFGFIADWEDAAGHSELVSRGGKGEVEGFQYERMTAVLTKTAQKHDALIAAMAVMIEQLKARLDAANL